MEGGAISPLSSLYRVGGVSPRNPYKLWEFVLVSVVLLLLLLSSDSLCLLVSSVRPCFGLYLFLLLVLMSLLYQAPSFILSCPLWGSLKLFSRQLLVAVLPLFLSLTQPIAP